MRTRWLLLVAGVTACTSAEPVYGPDNGSPDDFRDGAALSDVGLDGAPNDAAVRPCSDCEYFPETCSPDVLCPNGPFDPAMAGGALNLRTSINVIRGRSVADVWAAGAVGAIARFDGSSWTRFDLGTSESMRTLWLRDTVEVSIGGQLERIYARGVGAEDGGTVSGGGFTLHAPSFPSGEAPTSALLTSTWSAPGSEWLWCGAKGWATGANGGLWRIRQSPSSSFEGSLGIPAAVCRTFGCSQVSSIHGASADVLWAVGPAGATVRVTDANGDTPSVKTFNSQTLDALNGVWVASDSEAWSVGAAGTIRHYTGDPMLWDVVANVPTSVDLNAIWGASPTDIWAVGDAGVVLHFDGNGWSRVKVAGLGSDRPDLGAVWVAASGHVWIGGQGVILSLGGKP